MARNRSQSGRVAGGSGPVNLRQNDDDAAPDPARRQGCMAKILAGGEMCSFSCRLVDAGEGKELLARAGVLAECAEQGGGDGVRSGRLHSTQGHATVSGLDHNANSFGLQLVSPIIAVPAPDSAHDKIAFSAVVSPAPAGDQTARLWDGIVAAASTPGFYEIKRTRTVGPIFERPDEEGLDDHSDGPVREGTDVG